MAPSEIIIENINATMSMEDMPLSQSDKERIKECIEGNVNFQEAVTLLIQNHLHKDVSSDAD